MTAHNAGTPSEIYASRERRLNALQYERIPGIDSDRVEADRLGDDRHRGLERPGRPHRARHPDGGRQGPVGDLPASVQAQRNEIVNETALQLAVHQFTAEYAEQVIAFFTRYVP